jgi:large-conductance mechanosensitive channel
MKVILYGVVIYLVIRYLLRPILMAFVVKSAGKMMQDMQGRSAKAQQQEPAAPVSKSKPAKEVPGEYIDYEEIK